ncbi:MAG: hypothetical protein IPK60_23610 [Sandaracinaceae bacterium]|jgi:dolichyl-phosphate-mannose--protein O-mannosyl transferase|nr:hypothetical protein [Sandaracinaceae bacterium]
MSLPLVVAACVPLLCAAVLWNVARKSQTPRRYVVHLGLCVLVSLLVAVVTYFVMMSGAFESVADASPAEKTRLLSEGIASAMKGAAFAAAMLIPISIAFVHTLARKTPAVVTPSA